MRPGKVDPASVLALMEIKGYFGEEYRRRNTRSAWGLRESSEEVHITFTGDKVLFGSDECIDDLDVRIQDACRQRDVSSRRSDTRENYNALLKSLRRAKKAAVRARGY